LTTARTSTLSLHDALPICFAEGRAAALSSRGAGDALIRDALERAGVAVEVVGEAIDALPREAERARAVAERRGGGARTARYLNAKGFSRETIAELLVRESPDEIG